MSIVVGEDVGLMVEDKLSEGLTKVRRLLGGLF